MCIIYTHYNIFTLRICYGYCRTEPANCQLALFDVAVKRLQMIASGLRTFISFMNYGAANFGSRQQLRSVRRYLIPAPTRRCQKQRF
jgi:hypothetical protein